MAHRDINTQLTQTQAPLIVWQQPWINDRYTQIINYIPKSPSHRLNSYLTNLKSSPLEKQDLFDISFEKRPGFTSIRLYERDGSEENLIEIDRTKLRVTDSIFLDGSRFLFITEMDDSKMYVYKQIQVTEPKVWYNYQDERINEWSFVKIFEDEFDKYLFNKFTTTDYVKWKVIHESMDGNVQNNIVWATQQTFFYDTNTNIEAKPWDYLMIDSGSPSTQVMGISDVNYGHENKNWLLLETPVLWAVSIWKWPASTVLSRKVYRNYGDVLVVATKRGLVILNYLPDKMSEVWYIYEWNTSNGWFIISSIVNTGNSLMFYDIREGTLYSWLSGYQKFFFDPRNSYTYWKNYSDLIAIWRSVILLWPSNIIFFQQTFIWEGWVTFSWYSKIDDKVWFHNRYSRDTDGSVLYLVTNTWEVMILTLQVLWENAISPKIEYLPMVYSSDIADTKEDMYISVLSEELYIFTTDLVDTKVLIRNNQNIRYKWMLVWIWITTYNGHTWFGKDVYTLGGYKDNWQDYKTIIQYTYGVEDLTNYKTLRQLKVGIWCESFITQGNTSINTTSVLWGWESKINYNDLWRTDYVQRVMQAHNKWDNTDNIVSMPIWFEINNGNAIWQREYKYRTFNSEMNEFKNYDKVLSRDSNERTDYTVAKFGVIWIPYDIWWEVFNVEFVTKGNDRLEFLWASAIVSAGNPEEVRLENTLTVHDFINSWNTGFPLTKDSGIDNWADT